MSEYRDYGYSSSGPIDAHKYIYPTLQSMLDKNVNKKILDVGCGNGYIARELIKLGYDVYGIDASTEGITIAQSFHKDRFFVQDLADNEIPERIRSIKFDTIISTEVIEHLYDPKKYIKFCKDILLKNNGGEIIISTPYNGYFKNLILSLLDGWDRHLDPLWDGGHIKFWSKKTLRKILLDANFDIISFKGSGRIPYVWKSMFIKASL
jgi:2-polyprenyl-3-methyl-5-hydroxy-6-metoxy-1,4-benzoquinol methylase